MTTRVNIQDIKVQWLNAKCLNLIAKYARQACEYDMTKIRMSSDTCLVDVVEHATQTHNRELRTIYRELKEELSVLLSSDHLQPKLDGIPRYDNGQRYEISDLRPSRFQN